MRVTDRPLQRILVALDTSAHGRAALEAAVILAADLHAELLGLFVRTPTSCASRPSRSPARPTRDRFARSRWTRRAWARVLRAEAEQLRRRFAAEAGRLHVRWTFEVTRGPVEREVLARPSASIWL